MVIDRDCFEYNFYNGTWTVKLVLQASSENREAATRAVEFMLDPTLAKFEEELRKW